MTGTTNCVYETPCGWCSKWDKKCDGELPVEPELSHEKHEPAESVTVKKAFAEAIQKLYAPICQSASDHEWECVGVSPTETLYECKRCGKKRAAFRC